MAEESDQERTEAPSPQRLEKAREEGQVPQSRELATFVVLMTSGAALWMMASGLAQTLSTIVRGGLQFEPAIARDSAYVMTQLSDQFLAAALALAIAAPALVMAALVEGEISSAGQWTTQMLPGMRFFSRKPGSLRLG